MVMINKMLIYFNGKNIFRLGALIILINIIIVNNFDFYDSISIQLIHNIGFLIAILGAIITLWELKKEKKSDSFISGYFITIIIILFSFGFIKMFFRFLDSLDKLIG